MPLRFSSANRMLDERLATAICVAGEALAPALLAAYPQMRAMLTRLDGTSIQL